MIAATTLQTAYNNLYTQMRKYVWDFDIIEKLADVEIAVYQTFPDLSKLCILFDSLNHEVSYTDAFSDDDLQQAFTDFGDIIKSDTDVYCNLKTFKEVVVL